MSDQTRTADGVDPKSDDAATWRPMRAFGARGVAASRRQRDAAAEGLARTGGWEDLDRLLAESDIVSSACRCCRRPGT